MARTQEGAAAALRALVFFIALSMSVAMSPAVGCYRGQVGCFHYESNNDLANKEFLKRFRSLATEHKEKEAVVSSELRWVPSGPDPLHHNGSPPKKQKPKTP